MKKPLALFGIGLFFGAGIGFLVAAANEVTLSGHDHGDPAHHGEHAAMVTHGGHGAHHALLDISGEGPVPSVSLAAHPDTGDAVNLEIITENFTFAPEAVNGPHVPGQGHAHVYLNGQKVARAYGAWFHLSGLPETGAEIRVTLNANSHEPLARNGAPIEAVVTVPGG